MTKPRKTRRIDFVIGEISSALLVTFAVFVIGSESGAVDWLFEAIAGGARFVGFMAAFIYAYWIPVSIGLGVAAVLAALDRKRVPAAK